jgi:hypothetical protein
VDPLSEAAFTHLSYIIGISTQVLLYCWFGNEVEIKVLPTTSMPPTFHFIFQSSQIPYAIYKSDWFGRSVGVKTSLLILSVRCQQPVRITAINLFVLSLRTFVAVRFCSCVDVSVIVLIPDSPICLVLFCGVVQG